MSQRPRTKFHDFHGRPEEWDVFLSDAKVIFELFPSPKQRILQMAAICPDEEIKNKILCYSGSGESGPEQAIENLRCEFGLSHLNRPILLHRIRDLKTAPNIGSV